MKKMYTLMTVLALLGVSCATGAAPAPDVVSAASQVTNVYTNLDQAALLTAISQYRGVCTVSTVNADGSPNLAIFVPGKADDNHVMFGWAQNATKANFLRTKQAVLSYDIPNPAGETKEARHQGAIVKIVLEEDQAVLDQIKASLPEALAAQFSSYVICRIVEVRAVG
jgi:hypothetical protein